MGMSVIFIAAMVLLFVNRIMPAELAFWTAVYGTIRDANTGEPVPDCTIYGNCGWASLETKPYPDGAYIIDVPADGVVITVISPNKHYPWTTTLTGMKPLTFNNCEIALTPYPPPETPPSNLYDKPRLSIDPAKVGVPKEKPTGTFLSKEVVLQTLLSKRADLAISAAFEQTGCKLDIVVVNAGQRGIAEYLYSDSGPFLWIKIAPIASTSRSVTSFLPVEKNLTLRELDPDKKLTASGGRVIVPIVPGMDQRLQVQVEAKIDLSDSVNELRKDNNILKTTLECSGSRVRSRFIKR